MKNEEGYAICFNKWLFDKQIKNELRLLLLISSYSASPEGCFATNKHFADKLGEHIITISDKISKLEKLGYITIEFEKKGSVVIKRKIWITDLKKINNDNEGNNNSTVSKNTNGTISKNTNGTVSKNTNDNNTSINNTIIKENIKRKENKVDNLDFVENEKEKEILQKWLDYKKSRKQTYKSIDTIQICYNHLKELSNGNVDTMEQIVNRSISNNYSGLFGLNGNNGTYNKNNNVIPY